MGRYGMRLRSIYDADEPTGGERIMGAVQGGLDWYAQRRETARQEANQVGAAGGERLPDQPVGGLRGRVQRGIAGALARIPGLGGLNAPQAPTNLPQYGGYDEGLRPTGTFVESRPSRPGAFPMDENPEAFERSEADDRGIPDADDMVSGAIARGLPPDLRRVVPPTPPVGALPPSPRITPRGGPSITSAGPTAPMGGPMLYAGSMQPERTFEYQGSDGARYRMPQTGERERSNRMLEYGAQMEAKDAIKHRDDDEQIAALVAGGMPPAEARARVLSNTVRYDEVYGQQRNKPLTFEERKQLVELSARLRAQGRFSEARQIDQRLRERQLDIAEKREERLGREGTARIEQGAGKMEAGVAATEQRGVVTNPIDKRMLERDPRAKAANDARQARVDQSLQRARESANRTRNSVASPEQARARIAELRRLKPNITAAEIKTQMRAEGYPDRF